MSDKFVGYFRLLEACGRPGCPVCRCLVEDGRRYLGAVTHEQVTDPDLRRRLRASWGLCNWHTWMLLDVETAASGVAIINEDMIRVASERVQLLGGRPDVRWRLRPWWQRLVGWRATSSALARLYRRRAACPACEHAAAAEAGYLDAMLELGAGEDLAQAYEMSDGLCVPHVVQAVERAPGPEPVKALVARTLARWTRLRADLESFVRKHEYRNRQPFTEAEADSCARALAVVAGARSLFGNDMRSRGRRALRGRRIFFASPEIES